MRRDGMWFVHAVISLILNVATGFSVRHRVLRSVSKGFFTEGSTVRSYKKLYMKCVENYFRCLF